MTEAEREELEETIRVLEQFLHRIRRRMPQPEKETGTDPDVEIFCNQQDQRTLNETLPETLRRGTNRAVDIIRGIFSQ